MNRCQVCGRAKPIRADGKIVMHHVRSMPCRGAGAPPIEHDDAALMAARDRMAATERHLQSVWQDHQDRRLNAPLEPWFWKAWSDATREALRLEGRIRRLTAHARRTASLA